jgi:diguanylate cyclase (GGDEF)-like protein
MDAAHQLGGILNKELLVNRLVALVRDKLGWPDFAIFLTHTNEGNESYLKLAVASGLPNIDIIKALTFNFGEGITGLVAESKTPALIKNLAQEKRIKIRDYIEKQDNVPEFLTIGSMLSVPMLYQGKTVGVMDFFHPELNAFDDDDAALSHALGALAAVALVNADLYEATLELATSDPLTGVLNRRAMERLLDAEVNRAERFGTPLALLMIDVDHFKNFNDRMGHVVGDLVLKEVAHRLKQSIRKVDAVARFGGEEFCVILPQTDARQALEVAHKLCIAIRAIEIRGSSKQPLGHFSISVGVAVFPTHVPKTLSRNPSVELIHAADEALYQAKREGRDRVITYEAK